MLKTIDAETETRRDNFFFFFPLRTTDGCTHACSLHHHVRSKVSVSSSSFFLSFSSRRVQRWSSPPRSDSGVATRNSCVRSSRRASTSVLTPRVPRCNVTLSRGTADYTRKRTRESVVSLRKTDRACAHARCATR